MGVTLRYLGRSGGVSGVIRETWGKSGREVA